MSERSPVPFTKPSNRKFRCLLVYPEFKAESFWNYRDACTVLGVKYPAAPLGLLTVAALLPKEWELKLVDRNVQDFDEKLFEWADLILFGGMMPQQRDHLDLIELAIKYKKPIVSGGPDATSSPHIYDRATYLVLGEAEVTLAEFIKDFLAGNPRHIYQSDDQADITSSPLPRWDLVDPNRYLYLSIQWSRGCPFNCEFCDIIELFGRVPRTKTKEQLVAELNQLYDLGHRGAVDIVDDNFIGNQKLVKELLPEMTKWQEEHGWPYEFGTEASLNICDKPKIMELMQKAGFTAVFMGIETPDEETLALTQKKQNTKRDIGESIHELYKYGIAVMAGYILGFDGEGKKVAASMESCIKSSSIPVNMVGLLFALPNTQLTRRLLKEGRLPENYDRLTEEIDGDQCSAGLNYDTTRPKSEILADYAKVLEEVYSPEAYFERVRALAVALNCKNQQLNLGFRKTMREAATFFRALWNLGLKPSWRGEWWKTFIFTLRKNPKAIRIIMWKCILYTHLGPFARSLIERTSGRAETVDAEVKEPRAVSLPATGTSQGPLPIIS